ncbi:MAG: hypothetical protein NTX45_19175 [Proteobacteria bacterium]|nr:hypothetical protein [Pseudomonadota bacterium]
MTKNPCPTAAALSHVARMQRSGIRVLRGIPRIAPQGGPTQATLALPTRVFTPT